MCQERRGQCEGHRKVSFGFGDQRLLAISVKKEEEIGEEADGWKKSRERTNGESAFKKSG